MRSSNMFVKIENTKNNAVSSKGASKMTDGNFFNGTAHPGPFKPSVGDIALQKIKKYEEKYFKGSSTGDKVQGLSSVSEGSDVDSGPEATPQSGETSRGPNLNASWLGNVKFANFSDTETPLEILSDLSSVKPVNQVASATKLFAEPKMTESGEDSGDEVLHSSLIMTEVDAESSSVSTYLQSKILPIENLKLDESDEDKCKNMGNTSNNSKSSSIGKMAKLSCSQSDIFHKKSPSYSESFEDVDAKSTTEVNTESDSDSVNLSRVRRPEPKARRRSGKGKETRYLNQAGAKLETKSTQTVFKNVTKTPLHSFVNPSPSTSVPEEDDCHLEPFLLSKFNMSVNVEGTAHFDLSREVLKQQIALTKHYIGCQRAMYRSYCQSVERLAACYKPVTLRDTEKLIRKHRCSRCKKRRHSERKTGDE